MKSGKSVVFSERSALYIVADLSKGPHKWDLWYAPNELRQFKASTGQYVKVLQYMMSSKSKSKLRAEDILGMERLLTPALAAEYTRRRDRHVRGMLFEAWRGDGITDTDRLARISAKSSAWAVEQARAAALLLEYDQEEEGRRLSRKLQEKAYRRRESQHESQQETIEPRGELPNVRCWC